MQGLYDYGGQMMNTEQGSEGAHQGFQDAPNTQSTRDLPPVNEAPNHPLHDWNYLETGTFTEHGFSAEPKRYFEGLAANARVMGIPKADLLRSDTQSPFNSIVGATSDFTHLPISLRPSTVQHRHPHHPFFDCIPIPGFRDRVILASAVKPPLVNRFVICFDLFAGGLTFIGDSTDEQAWIFSDAFREKWGRLLVFDLEELQRRADETASS